MDTAAFILALLALFLVILLHLRVNRLELQSGNSSQAISFDPMAVSDRVRELAKDSSRKIEAIKVLREETGLGLAESKRVVEQLARDSS
jgi:ribosomal protein L7/L12